MPPAGFEPTNPAGERLEIYALDHTASGTGHPYIEKQYYRTVNSGCVCNTGVPFIMSLGTAAATGCVD